MVCPMDFIEQWLAWYLAPWRRMGRGPFNTVLAVAAIPSMLLGVWGLVDGVGGILSPLTQMMDAGRSLQQGVGGAGVDAGALGEAMRQMQGAGEGLASGGDGAGGFAWAELLDLAIWLALLPLMQMRLRDMGVAPKNVWVWTAILYAGMVVSDVQALTGVNLFGGWSWLVGVVGFVLLGWMTVAKSRPREQKEVTDGGASAKVRLDDTDPYPPFRP